jgi:alpha-mannosidase
MIPRILFPARIEASAARQFQVRGDPAPAAKGNGMRASAQLLSNGDVTVSLGSGGIAQISLGGTELLGAGGIGLHLRRDTTDTWTFHTDQWDEGVEEELAGGEWHVEESGPLRVRARLDARLRSSRIRWTVSLCRGEKRVTLDLDVNFDERFTLLQMPIALRAAPARWSDGIAGAHIDRTPSPSEWPFLGWSRVRVGKVDIGLVTNDCYSHSVDGTTWQPTLLRSPKMAWGGGEPAVHAGRDHHTDQGVHRFRFELHLGETLPERDLARAARRDAQPLVVFDRYEGMDRPAWGPVPPRGLWGPAMERNLAEGRVEDPGQPERGGLFKRPGHDYAG